MLIPQTRSSNPLVLDAIEIWSAGVNAVRGDTAVTDALAWDGRWLAVGGRIFDLEKVGRLIVVGAGKATASMADGLLRLFDRYPESRPNIMGWINVPEGSFDPKLTRPLHIHAARSPGVNEPTLKAYQGAQQIMHLVADAKSNDLVICLISGGSSALLPLPVEGVSLEDKLQITRVLSQRGANIEELNTVRRALSQVKGGGLARACAAGTLITLVLSDVLGDPLHLIGSGPTWLEHPVDPTRGLEILRHFDPKGEVTPKAVVSYLEFSSSRKHETKKRDASRRVEHFIVGNNSIAIDHAAQHAQSLNYRVITQYANGSEGDVAEVADQWFKMIRDSLEDGLPFCMISGGEPTVTLPKNGSFGKGGRNQHLVLSMLERVLANSIFDNELDWTILSGGTDGEDGPTDAAGAWVSLDVIERMQRKRLEPKNYIDRCDAYRFFEEVDGLLLSGPTGTNVCDLRVALVRSKRVVPQ